VPTATVGSIGQGDRGCIEPTDHGLDLNTDVLGKLLRTGVRLLEIQDECQRPALLSITPISLR